ncbi:hypothetical protein JB92DRAFT_2833633 [Gautieria morchelliformis]|nr:hypothetical protein JB92DRAFT_2833633 [Gautieria morchelliformis]
MAPVLSKCSHVLMDDESETKCCCPTFEPRTAPDDEESKLCNCCMHSVAWHISITTSPPPSQLMAEKIDAILSTFAHGAQASASGSSSTSAASSSTSAASSSTSAASSSSSQRHILLKAMEDQAKKEAFSGLKRTVQYSDIESRPKPDGMLKHTAEPTPQQIDELVKLGFAMIGSKGELWFGKEWDTARLDQWLQDTLPVPFECIDLMADVPDVDPHWQLLRIPHSYDFIDAKGSRGKSWHDSKLYVDIVEAMDSVAVQVQKSKGKVKAMHKWKACLFGDSDDNAFIPGPSKGEHSVRLDDNDINRVSIDTATLEEEFQIFENKVTQEKPHKIHMYGLPRPTLACPWMTATMSVMTPATEEV